jgi:hypothetical protein
VAETGGETRASQMRCGHPVLSKERLLEAVKAPARKSGRTKAALTRRHDYAGSVVLGCTPLVGIEGIKARLRGEHRSSSMGRAP